MRPDSNSSSESNSSLVWYAAYGSNLAADRLRCYLEGGCAPGARRRQRGARDPRAPLASRPVRLPFVLRFAGTSTVWGGGKAFVRPSFRVDRVGTCTHALLTGAAAGGARVRGGVLGRAWLLRGEQFDDLTAQESSRARVCLGIDELRRRGRIRLGHGAYDLVVHCGELDSVPVVTFTTPHEPAPNPPSAAYVRTLARGLRDSHGLSPAAAARYLADAEGVDASADELHTIIGTA